MAKAGKLDPGRYAKVYQRLRNQARMWERATGEVLDRVGLEPGMSCLDVGADPGEVMRLMADRVGPDGLVTGIEVDPALGADALRDLRAEGTDVLKLETRTGAPFDFSFCRPLLMHQRDAVAVLEKMLHWTNPGGVVLAQEFDVGAIAVEPPAPLWPSSTACSRACSAAMAETCGPGGSSRRNSGGRPWRP